MKQFLILLFCLASTLSIGQETNPDDLCFFLNDLTSQSVVENDMGFDPVTSSVFLISQSQCFVLHENGDLSLIPGADPERCCGMDTLMYGYVGTQIREDIYVNVKCDAPKPECAIVNLEDYKDGGSTGLKPIVHACDESAIVYHVDDLPGVTYVWDLGVIPYSFVSGDHSIEVTWPNAGSYTILLDEVVGGVVVNSYTFCVDVVNSPEAEFSVINGCGCLNAPVSFNNMSIGGSDFFWKFGDGNTSSDVSPTYTYTTPGVYNVTLYVTQDNYDLNGNPLCCCTDSIVHEVIIDPKEGPPIYWISTLCEGDTSKYWTTAEVCDYIWSVEDADGNIVPIISSPVNNDTICVVWGSGPYGVVSLEVENCTIGDYCEKPVSAIVPIIEANSTIAGQDTVCEYSNHTYSVPKWGTVEYDWWIDPAAAGSIVGGQGSNSVNISWNGANTIATLNVDYESDFLNGLPNHSGDDCSGSASLEISIFKEYAMTGPLGPICANQPDTFGTSLTAINGFTWEVDPPGGPITGLGNAPLIYSFPSAGTYTVKVWPNYPNPFCNDTITRILTVIEVSEPDSISGPKEVCEGDTELYFGNGAYPGSTYMWSVSGGTIIGSNLGNPLTVSWNGLPPYAVHVKNVLIDDMTCFSDTITCNVDVKTLMPFDSISGAAICVNKISTFTVYQTQHDDAVYDWTISPPNMGSVISGNNSTMAEIQWNDTPGPLTLTCKAYLCGDSVSIVKTLMLNEATAAIIVQSDTLCPGGSTMLDAGPGYVSYDWSPTASGQIITISTAGNYVLTVTDSDGCTAVSNYQVLAYPSPNVDISIIGDNVLCIGAGGGVQIHGLDGDVSIDWFVDGVNVGPGVPDQAVYNHPNTNVINSTSYCYVATDNSTGCTAKSNTIVVYQQNCSGGGTGTPCIPAQPYSLSFNAVNQSPNCRKVNFTPINPDLTVTITGWDFDGPTGTYTGPLTSPMYEYDKVGYHNVELYGTVPSTTGGTCDVEATGVVCIPLVADFTCSVECDTARFTDESTFITGNNITAWEWDFGDTNMSTTQNPNHTYGSPGTYDVVLVVTSGICTDTFEKEVIIPATTNPIINIPSTACVGEEVIFTNLNNTDIIAWDWNFGDGSSNGDIAPSHAYTMGGTDTVTLLVTDETGCTGADTTSILIYPAPVEDTILYSPDLILCDGEDLVLFAPLGSSYSWNTGAITQDITVDATGTYAVTILDNNGCEYIPDSVDVTVLPPMDSTITGPTTICDDGCITLFASSAFGYMYQWTSGGIIGTESSVEVCMSDGFTMVNLLVTDANGCTAENSVNISYATSPTVSISSSDPSLCEGVPITLTANVFPAGPPYAYQWSTGASTPSITVISAGVYTVNVTDLDTGCSTVESITINPIPDLCIVPQGCYTACDPDTLCGPDGLISYIWTKDGAFFGNTQCVEVTESGAYTLMGTNTFNCSNTSDTLFLDIIPCCEPDDTEVTAALMGPEEDCCYLLTYDIIPDYFDKFTIRSNDADIDLDYASLDPDLQVLSNVGGYQIGHSTSGTAIPAGMKIDFAKICLNDATNDPVQVIIDWMYGDEMCSDTIELACISEPDCIYINKDSIFCEGDIWIYQAEICNPVDAEYSIGYIDLVNIIPIGVMTPSFLNLSPPLAPGECRVFTFTISGSNLANTNFYFDLVGHENDPNLDPGTECCSLDTTYCTFIPGCSPCDSVYVSSIDSSDVGDCCYDITVHNYYDDAVFSGIDICVLTPNATITSLNTTSDWITSGLTGTTASWNYNSATGTIPLGYSTLPTICIDESDEATVSIEIKWMHGTDVMCRDTIELICPGDCGYMSNIKIDCSPQGGWNISGYITNTSEDTMHTAYIDWGVAALDPYDITINLLSLPPGQTFGPFNVYIGPEAGNGAELCITTTLHTLGHGNEHEFCCDFKTTITLPDCDNDKPCNCDKSFRNLVDLGINCILTPPTSYGFNPNGLFSDCDEIFWYVDDKEVGSTAYNQSFAYTFPGPGEYEVCMVVIRTASNGKQCKRRYCKEVMIFGSSQLKVFPNPAQGKLNVAFESMKTDRMADVELYSLSNKLVLSRQAPIDETISTFDVSTINTGTYIMKVKVGDEEFIRYVLIVD